MKQIRAFILLSLTLIVGGCASYGDKFSCSAYPDMGCTPTEHVYKRTNGELVDYRRSRKSSHQEDEDGESVGVQINIAQSQKQINYITPGDPVLTNPRKLRILFFPWQDKEKDLNAGGYVYVKLGEPEWLILQ